MQVHVHFVNLLSTSSGKTQFSTHVVVYSVLILVLSLSVSSGGNIPRGIVTATTVPKGSSFTSSPLPNTLQQQLQQQSKTNQTHAKSVTGSPSKLPTANATPSTNEHASPVITNCMKSSNTHTATLSNPDKTAVESPSPLSQTTNSDGSKAGTAVVSSTSSSTPTTTSVNPTPVTASSLASQLLDAHSLLQQQGAGTANSSSTMANSAPMSLISPELLAQVSSFLNVPGQNTSLTDASESVAGVSASAASESADQGKIVVRIVGTCILL